MPAALDDNAALQEEGEPGAAAATDRETKRGRRSEPMVFRFQTMSKQQTIAPRFADNLWA